MRQHMYVCMCVCVCVCMHACVFMNVCVCMCLGLSSQNLMCMMLINYSKPPTYFIRLSVYLYVCNSFKCVLKLNKVILSLCVCMCLCVYVCVCVCVCVGGGMFFLSKFQPIQCITLDMVFTSFCLQIGGSKQHTVRGVPRVNKSPEPKKKKNEKNIKIKTLMTRQRQRIWGDGGRGVSCSPPPPEIVEGK